MTQTTRAGYIAEGPFRGLPYRQAGVIYADPATQFQTRSERGKGRSAERHYRTMPLRDILALPVQDLCAEDCWLFLWITNPLTPKLMRFFDEWGFAFSGVAFTWVKTNPVGPGWHFGMGYGTRQNTERVYLGRRGSPPRCARNISELVFAPVEKPEGHSKKPPQVAWRIDRFAGDVPKVELFSRGKPRPGWWLWGDELGKH
jgi:N6-adenosine-specific RNA methylase IME4